jgi:hypothetical protein
MTGDCCELSVSWWKQIFICLSGANISPLIVNTPARLSFHCRWTHFSQSPGHLLIRFRLFTRKAGRLCLDSDGSVTIDADALPFSKIERPSTEKTCKKRGRFHQDEIIISRIVFLPTVPIRSSDFRTRLKESQSSSSRWFSQVRPPTWIPPSRILNSGISLVLPSSCA